MATDEEYQKNIQQHEWADLIELWGKINARETPGWPAGKAFEYLILRAFQLEGAYVHWPYTVTVGEVIGSEAQEAAEQIDGFVHTDDGLACLIECKDYRDEKANLESIAKLRNQLLRRSSTAIGAVFSRAGFTATSTLLARFTAPQTILLWDGDEIEIALRNHWFCRGLTAKYRICLAKGVPDFHIDDISMGV